MADLIDGDGEVITDGDGAALFDGDGTSTSSDILTMTGLDPFLKRIKMDIQAPEPIVLPFLYDIFREFSEKTWILYRSYQVQGSGVADSVNKSVAFNTTAAVIGLIPIALHRLEDESRAYNPRRSVVEGTVTDSFHTDSGSKLYNFFSETESGSETMVRVFPWTTDPLLTLGIAFRPSDEPATVSRVFLEYKEAICAGAEARLMEMPGKPWTNPGLSGVKEAKYQGGISQAKSRWFREASQSRGRRSFI